MFATEQMAIIPTKPSLCIVWQGIHICDHRPRRRAGLDLTNTT